MYVCIYVYVCMYVCMYAYVYIYIYIHIHVIPPSHSPLRGDALCPEPRPRDAPWMMVQ